MDIGDIFSDSLGYPSKSLKRVVVLGILSLFSILIIPFFMLFGYALRVMRKSIEGETEPPVFDDLGAMIVDGLKYLVVSIVYFLIPMILMGIGITSAITSGTSCDMMDCSASIITILAGSGLFLLGVLLLLVISVIETIGVANMAHTGKLGAAFRFGEILRIIGSIGWGRYIIWYIILNIIVLLCTVAGLLAGIIPIVGALVYVLLIAPYATIFQYRATGLIYREGI